MKHQNREKKVGNESDNYLLQLKKIRRREFLYFISSCCFFTCFKSNLLELDLYVCVRNKEKLKEELEKEKNKKNKKKNQINEQNRLNIPS